MPDAYIAYTVMLSGFHMHASLHWLWSGVARWNLFPACSLDLPGLGYTLFTIVMLPVCKPFVFSRLLRFHLASAACILAEFVHGHAPCGARCKHFCNSRTRRAYRCTRFSSGHTIWCARSSTSPHSIVLVISLEA